MNKLRQALLFILLAFALFISSCTRGSGTQTLPMKCIKPFQEFAFSRPEPNPKTDIVLPSFPWAVEATVPIRQVEGYTVLTIDTEVTRMVDGHQEIWLFEHLYPIESRQSNPKNVFLIYQPDSQEWENVSATIEDTNLYVQDLFVTSDGSVWGKTVWVPIYGQPDLDKIPVLSKFNENTRRFEFAKDALDIPPKLQSDNIFPLPAIVLDTNDVFWIFANNDGIYRYDPDKKRTEKQADLFGLNVAQEALSPDGSIFYEIFSEKIYSKEDFFRLVDGMLFQFTPNSKEIIPLDIPDEPWPVSSGMLVDQDEKLWLGASGYRELNGNWHLINPNVEEYFKHAGDIYWASPSIMFQSSNGILWYKKSLSDIRADGTAWYNPDTGEGCMFTNLAVNIIEDSKQQLWLFAEGKLYKYSVNPLIE